MLLYRYSLLALAQKFGTEKPTNFHTADNSSGDSTDFTVATPSEHPIMIDYYPFEIAGVG
jgi:hypothetical protein